MNLFVAGLPSDIDDQELQQIFEEFGSVSSSKVILDKETRKSRGFGFVEMSNDAQAEKAIRDLNGSNLDGKTLTVKVAEDRKNSSGSGGYRSRDSRGGYNKDRNRY